MKYLFSADWFYSPEYIGNKIKSPVELIVGIQRHFPIVFNKPETLIVIQAGLGQILYAPPNVAGWKGGKDWIDSTSLIYRLKLASTVLNSGVIDFTPKGEIAEEAMYMGNNEESKHMKLLYETTMDWQKFNSSFSGNTNEIKQQLNGFLLSKNLPEQISNSIFETEDTDAKAIALKLVSLPEYQLC